MTIDEAIDILSATAFQHSTTFNDSFYDAIKLGIEALKGIRKVRKNFEPYVTALLPGETEEKVEVKEYAGRAN